jgi:hypothetical protein
VWAEQARMKQKTKKAAQGADDGRGRVSARRPAGGSVAYMHRSVSAPQQARGPDPHRGTAESRRRAVARSARREKTRAAPRVAFTRPTQNASGETARRPARVATCRRQSWACSTGVVCRLRGTQPSGLAVFSPHQVTSRSSMQAAP